MSQCLSNNIWIYLGIRESLSLFSLARGSRFILSISCL